MPSVKLPAQCQPHIKRPSTSPAIRSCIWPIVTIPDSFSNRETWKVEEVFSTLHASMSWFPGSTVGQPSWKTAFLAQKPILIQIIMGRFLAPRNSSGHPSALGSFQREAVSQVIDHHEPGSIWLMPESRQQSTRAWGWPLRPHIELFRIKKFWPARERRVSQLHKLKNSAIKS